MIKIEIFRDRNNYIKKYTIFGHANFDVHGRDIVCAAISVLSQTALLSLVEVCGLKEESIEYTIDDKTGFLDVNLPRNIENGILEKTQIVLNTLVVGINSVIESYPKYVTLQDREV